jgi:hypothetical protein
MRITRLVTTTFLLGSILLSGAAGAANVVMYSGFIDHYPDLKQDADGGGGLIYRKTGVDLGNYDKILIEPIEIWMADDSKYKGFSPDDLKAITDEFYRTLLVNLEPDYPVVSQPGAGVLVVRLAITDVYAKKKKRGLLGYTPVGALAGAATGSYKANLKDATIEAELLDAQSQEQLGVLIDKLSVSKGGSDKTSWAEVTEALNFYAKRFRARMDAAHSN